MTARPAPVVVSVEAAVVSQRLSTTVVVRGENFFTRAVVGAEPGARIAIDREFAVSIGDVVIDGDRVTWVDSETLRVVLPKGLPLGVHPVAVKVPSGEVARRENAITVIEAPVGATLSIETAPGGQGTRLVGLDLVAGANAALYAVYRDATGAFVDDATVAWRQVPDLAELQMPASNTLFVTALHSGIGAVHAKDEFDQAARVEPFVVRPGAPVKLTIENAAGGLGVEVGSLALTTDDVLNVHAVTHDAFGNFVADEVVSWSVTGGVGALSSLLAVESALELNTPGVGRVRAVHDAFGEALTGNLIVSHGAAVRARVDVAPGDSVELGALTLLSGSDLMVYASGFDAEGHYTGPLDVVWSVTGGVGFVAPGPSPQVLFHATGAGTGQIVATPAHGLADGSGAITILGGSAQRISIETQPDGLGTVVTNQTLTTDQQTTYYAVGRDAAGNFVENTVVGWAWSPFCTSLGGLGAVFGSSVSFEPAFVGSCRLTASHATLPGAITGVIDVLPGALASVTIESLPDGSGVAIQSLAMTAGGPDCTAGACVAGCGACRFYSIGRDLDANPLGLRNVAWQVQGGIGSLDTTSGNTVVLTAMNAGLGQVYIDSPALPGGPDDYTGTVTVSASSAASYVVIEDAPDGAGSAVGNVTLAQGEQLALYAVGRDSFDNFVGLQSVTWAVTGGIGSANAGPSTSTTFTATGAGSGAVTADHATLTDTTTGTITVLAGTVTHVVIEDQPDGTGAAIGALALTAGDQVTAYAVGRTAGDAFVGLVSVAWSVSGGIGALSTLNGTSTRLTAQHVGSGVLTADHATYIDDVTGTLTVGAGPLHHVVIESTSGDPLDPVGAQSFTAGQALVLFAVGRDAFDNFVGAATVDWAVQGSIGSVDVASGASTMFTATTVGAGFIRASHATVTGGDTGTFTVSAGALAVVQIEDAAGGVGSEVAARNLTADQSLVVYAIGRDANGNFVSNASVTWAVTGGIGSIPPGPSSSAMFSAVTVGTGTVTANDGAGHTDATGTLTVSAGALHHVVIERSGGNPLDAIGAVALSAGNTLDVFAVGRDQHDNLVADVAVTWAVSGSIGTITPGPTTSATFTATAGGTGVITADHPSVLDDTTGTITVQASTCGNGVAEGSEPCDGADLRGESCSSLGFVQGAGGGLACNGACSAFVTSGCTGGAINSIARLDAAIDEAYARVGHETISIVAGTYAMSGKLILDEGPAPRYGVTLQPLSGAVTFVGTGTNQSLFQLKTGNNVFSQLTIVDDNGIQVDAPASGNTFTHMHFQAVANTTKLLHVDGDDTALIDSWFENTSGSRATMGVEIKGDNAIVQGNVFYGPYQYALYLNGSAGSWLDHNSIRLTSQLGSTGVRFNGSSNVCVRNNVIYGDADSTAWQVATTTFGNAAACGGVVSQKNDVANHQVQCSGACAGVCSGSAFLCDLTVAPAFTDTFLCLGSSALIDGAIDVGVDLVDGSAASFNGSAPDVGARERGSTRVFGASSSTCP